MKIHMGNIGMALHIIHKLRAQGFDNVQVNMDWQHLIMNGENLAEYAALLAAEGLLGHQHAQLRLGDVRRRQHGRRDRLHGDDRARDRAAPRGLRRGRGARSGLDLYPYTEDQVGAVKRSIMQWRFIDGVAARIDDAALREAQRARTRSAPTRSCTPPWAPSLGGWTTERAAPRARSV